MLTTHHPRDAAAALIAGMLEEPLFGTFLRLLGERTAALRVAMLLRGSGREAPMCERVARLRPDLPLPDFERLGELGLFPYRSLRPRRVYALAEMLSPDDVELRVAQDRLLAELAIADMRCLRIPSPCGADAWLVLVSDADEFGATAGAQLLSLEAAVGAALAVLDELETLRLRATAAEQVLARLGIDLAVRDGSGRSLEEPVGSGDHRDRDTSLRLAAPDVPAALRAPAATLDIHRQTMRIDRPAATAVVARELHLSPREAELAVALAQGFGLVEAGAELGLTAETARNYSKRIYLKTGATGQADLVRLVLSGLAPLAGEG